MPRSIVSDNGTEPTSNAILGWADDHKIARHDIAPGKPTQNAFIESFIGRLRDGRPRDSRSQPCGRDVRLGQPADADAGRAGDAWWLVPTDCFVLQL